MASTSKDVCAQCGGPGDVRAEGSQGTMITITLAQLRAMDACGSALNDFAAVFGTRAEFAAWTAAQQVGVLMHERLRRWLGWAWEHGLLPQWSMRGWDLSGVDMAGADLAGAYLRGAVLTGTDLTGADLARAVGVEA